MKNNCARLFKSASLAAVCLAFVACTNSGSDTPVTPSTLATQNSTDASGMTASGAMRSESNVTGHEFSAGESSSGGGSMSLEQILAAYPVLADRAAFLATIDRAVETDAGTWDLYADGALVMTLASNGAGGYTVVNATGGFMADSVTMVSDSSGDQSQGKSSSGIHFVTSSCKVEEPKQEQEQEKEPTQEQEQDKVPVQEGDKEPAQEQEQDKVPVKEETPKQEQEQDKVPVQEGDKEPAQEQEQDKSPVQEKEESKVEECASIEATLWLEEVEQKQEQEQEQEQEQDKSPEQEQDKSPEQEQDKSPEQEQDKSPEQEQDKSPEQEQDKAPEQEQDKAPEQEQDKKN